ncbi:MAG TPA: TonB-dependent receptor [Kofleriaceae bacterium]|nr:TonB-dependent receptor [Kofleriaceae bacterium]
MKKLLYGAASTLIALAAPASADVGEVSDVEVPTVVIDTGNENAGAASDDEALDLANIVQSAAKGVTTVQEAPAIVTVVTSDEIKDRQFQDLGELVDTVPGWNQIGLAHNTFIVPTVRGQVQAVQFLHDGVSLFDAFVNIPTISRVQPMETVKRVEMITGPGGVLWGSNSLLGIMNVITKDAEDVEGAEMGASLGHGDGDRMMARAYVMGGKADIAHGKVKVFGHGSVETYQGPKYDMPLLLFHNPLPQPNSPNTYGPLTSTDEKQSLIVNLDGKLTLGKFQLRGEVQTGKQYKPMGLSGDPVRYGDSDPRWDGITFPTGAANINDPNGAARENSWSAFDQYVVGEYRDRFAKDKAGIALRGYVQHFTRTFDPLNVLAPSQLIQGGLAFKTNLSSYRVGSAFDGDVEVAKSLRLLYGAEAFREWKPTDTTTSLQGSGNQADFISPNDLTRLPIPCPRTFDPMTNVLVPVPGCPQTFAYDASRTVLGVYADPQLRPNKKVILDAGARVQVAPEQLGSVGYPVTYTIGGAIVYNFIPNWHLKLNYTQGFRPPVFNNTSANGEAVVIAGSPDLDVEKSDATQVEINARIFKGDRRIRELSFRFDGSYTRLNGLIQVNTGSYGNTGDRGVSSGEFLGKLYIQGGHRVELGYTYMRVATSDRGLFKTLPENWFNLATVFNMVTGKLTGTTNIRVVGAAEDANRLVEYRDAKYDMNGNPMGAVTVNPTDLVMDRIQPIADLSVGVSWTPVEKLLVRATVYNALVSHTYQPDVFGDYEPHLEYLPNPYEGFRAYLTALYTY